MTEADFGPLLGSTMDSLPASVARGRPVYRGKVRDVVDLGSRLLLVTSDRISAFDRVLSTIPCKGEVLNRIAMFWFEATRDILPNHLVPPGKAGGLDVFASSPRTMLAAKAEMLPVEVVVRGYLTGSAWRDYEAGRAVSGIVLPKGMRNGERFPTPLLTPSTKESEGHDLPISGDEIVRRGLVPAELWKETERAALALFARGQEIARKNGLILVDTKYEFGLVDGVLTVCDEIHTPDSSRYWYADTYESLFAKGEKQRELDKEYFRQWLIGKGFMGDGPAPAIPDDVRIEVASRYVRAFETVTGTSFAPRSGSLEREVAFLSEAVEKLSV